MGVIFFGSTNLMSAEHTSRFLFPFLLWLDPHISAAALLKAHLFVRKAAHLTEYAILAGLLFRALRCWQDDFWPRAGIAFLPALDFALFDEFHQSFVPSRSSSLGDVGIDCLGALAGIAICRLLYLALDGRRRANENC
jgi:VanZ family protein